MMWMNFTKHKLLKIQLTFLSSISKQKKVRVAKTTLDFVFVADDFS